MASIQCYVIRPSLFFWASMAVVALAVPAPDCPTKCGSVNISYPFGIGDGCFLDGFDITCKKTFNTWKPFLGKGNIEVLWINTTDGLLRINQKIAQDCYGVNGQNRSRNLASMDISRRPYKFSDQNRFVAIGCDTLGYLIDGSPDEKARFSTGCASLCTSISYTENRTCSGVGCCETPLPKGLQKYHVRLESYYKHTGCWDFSPCSFAFVADSKHFTNFSTSSFKDLRDVKVYPVTLEWSIGDKDCEQNSVCVHNSYCYNAANVAGYRCNCSLGFTGNPYVTGGCVDINECEDGTSLCSSQCINTPGNYTCTCPRNMEGDGRTNGTGCKRRQKYVLPMVIGITSALIFLSGNIFWSYLALRKKKLIKLKEKFFMSNGGAILESKMSQANGAPNTMKIFSSEELTEATDNFSEHCILGKGGFGTVYRGTLSDGSVVAVKQSKRVNQEQNAQFINEVVVLSHTLHNNVVKLLGLCLETQVPLLVYELIPNGTLSDWIHDESLKGSLSFESRLRIAVDTAEALAYLHYSADIQILHRDVKSSNILLADNYVAKVSDFGMSRLVAFDQNCLNSLVQGTFGYLDPEYFQSGVFTEKSDVYSFGVVLVELLTGQKAVLLNRVPGNGNLAGYFISHYSENRLEEIYEDRVRDEGRKDQLLGFAEVAMRCLSVKRNERPTMKEVYRDLEELKYMKKPWIQNREEEVEPFLMKPLLDERGLFGISTSFSEGESSNKSILPFDLMR